MDKQAIIAATKELVTSHRPFVYATVDGLGNPHMRWMGGLHFEESFTIYLAASADSRKLEQIANQGRSQLLFQTDDFSRIANLTGLSEIVSDYETKQRAFQGISGASQYFSGPDDPDLAIIKFTCRQISIIGLTEGMAEDSVDL